LYSEIVHPSAKIHFRLIPQWDQAIFIDKGNAMLLLVEINIPTAL